MKEVSCREQMLSASQIAKEYGVHPRTARRYMKEMEDCKEHPFRVSRASFEKWKQMKTCLNDSAASVVDYLEIARIYERHRRTLILKEMRKP